MHSWAGWLLGPVSLGYPGEGSAGRSWAGWLLGLVPLGLLGWAGWLGEPSLSPWYPQCPHFPIGEEDYPRSEKKKKKRNKLDHHIIGNDRPSMLLNFQHKFCNFFETALDTIGSFELILRFRGSYKRLVGE